MKEEFNFKEVGKRTPYDVPMGFFEEVTQKTLELAKERDKKERHIKNRFRVAAFVATAAAAVIALALFTKLAQSEFESLEQTDSIKVKNSYGIAGKYSTTPTENIDTLLNNMSDDEIKLLADLTMKDVFYNQQ